MRHLLLGVTAALLLVANPAPAHDTDETLPSPAQRAATSASTETARTALRAMASQGLSTFQGARASPRIVNGETEIKDGQWAWTVSVIANGALCGGSYVAPHVVALNGGGRFVQDWVQRSTKLNWVITAAHCVVDRQGVALPPESIEVRGGTIRSDDSKRVRHAVERVKVHEGYDKDSLANDIALLLIGDPATPTAGTGVRMTSIRLPSDLDAGWLYKPYAALTVHGWGRTSDGGYLSPFLQKVVVPLVDRPTCSAAYQALGGTIAPSALCAGYSSGGFDSCQGDSGGPIEFLPLPGGVQNPSNDPILAGVVSWGFGCARQNLYGVYTNVLHMRPWLEKAVVELHP